MKQFLLLLSFFTGHLLFAQDYLIKERFEPDKFSVKDTFKLFSSNHKFVYDWALNTNINEEDELVTVWGSNLFSFSYAYNKPLYKGFHWNFGIGYNADNYRLKSRSDMMLHDSIGHEKVKLRVQHAFLKSGFRLQSSGNDLTSFYFEFLGYFNLKTISKYDTWDKFESMKLRSSTSRLSYVNSYNYGVEAKVGYGFIAIYSRYRISNIFDSESGFRELPRLALGITFEVSLY